MSLLKLKSEFCKRDTRHRLYSLDRPVIGLTGGIATGKSSASNVLIQKGLPLIDADALVKDIYAMDATKELVFQIAPCAVANDQIDFKILRQFFFNEPRIKQKLEEHIYAHLRQAFEKRLDQQTNPNFVIYDVPLLFEKGLQEKMDLTALVYAPEDLQLRRLLARDQIEPSLARKILSSQMPIEQKRKLAEFEIQNTSDLKHLEQQVNIFCSQVFEKI